MRPINERVRVHPQGMTPGSKRRTYTVVLGYGESQWPSDSELLELVGGAPFGGSVSEINRIGTSLESAMRTVSVWVD